MFYKLTAFCLVAVLLQIGLSRVSAQTPDAQTPDAQTTKVKAQIVKRGTGEKAKVKIELRDKTKVKGYIGKLGEDDFTIFDVKTQAQTKIAYRDVAKVKGWGLSNGAKIGIIAAITGGALAVAVIVAVRNINPLEGLILPIP